MKINDKDRYQFAMHCTMDMWHEWLKYLAIVRADAWAPRAKIIAARAKRWRKRFQRKVVLG